MKSFLIKGAVISGLIAVGAIALINTISEYVVVEMPNGPGNIYSIYRNKSRKN